MSDTSGIPTYEGVLEVIEKLRVSEHDDWHINDDTAAAAVAHVTFLRAAGAACPQLFPTGEDAIVFTWDHITPGVKYYLTITDEDTRRILIRKDKP